MRANLALIPVESRLWLPYSALLAFCIPLLAFLEECIFRYGTVTWVRGILIGGLVFGFLHLISLVSVRMAIYLTVVGLVFVEVYMTYGLIAVFVLHASYNLLALGSALTQKLTKPARPDRRDRHDRGQPLLKVPRSMRGARTASTPPSRPHI